MAEDSRAQRADARERRRSLASKPFEELDDAAEREQKSPRAGAKGVLGKAAAAALAGALAGAAKAYADRRAREKDAQDEPDEESEDTREGSPAPEEQARVTDEAEPQEETEETDEPQAEDEAEPGPEDDQPAEEHDSHEEETNGAHGTSSGDAARIVKQAREHLQDLLGIEAESVSGLNRSNGSWHVTVEAVEVRRVPESQDVLASYEVVLDDDGGVVSVERTHRYRRAQVEAD